MTSFNEDSILFLDTLIDEIAGLPAPQEIGHSTPAKKSELPTPPSVLRLPPLQLHHIAPVPLQSAAPTPEEEAPPPLPPKVHPSPLSHPVPATQHPPPPPKELPPKLPPHAKELPAVPNIHVSPRECIPPPLPPPRETPPPVPPRSHKSHLQLQQQQHSRVSPRPNDSASETTDKITTKHLPTKSASEYITLNTKDTPTSTKQQPTKSASESTITLGAKENEGKPSRSEFMIVSPPRTLRRTDSEFLSNSRVRRKAQPAPLSDMYPHLLSCWGSVSTLTSVRPDYVGSFTKEQLQEVQKRQQRESVRYSKLSIKGATTTADVVESLREDLHRINSDKLALQGKLGFRFPTKYSTFTVFKDAINMGRELPPEPNTTDENILRQWMTKERDRLLQEILSMSTLNIIVEENKAYRARISALEKQVATASTDLKLFKSKISELEQLRAANKKK